MSDMGIIGGRDLVGIFKMLGLAVYPAEDATEAKGILSKILKEGGPKILFVLESLAVHMKREMMEALDSDEITVVPLPDHVSEISYLDDELRRLSREAIGMEV